MRTLRVASGVLISAALAVRLLGRDLPPIDELGAARPYADASSAVETRARGLTRAGLAIPVEARLRVPTFIWAGDDAARPKGNPTPAGPRTGRVEAAAARVYVGRFASLYELNAEDVQGASVSMIHNTGRGPIIVKLRQEVNGIEIFREEMNIVMDRDLRLVAMGGYLTSASTPGAEGGRAFRVDDASGVANALSDLTDTSVRPQDVVRGTARGAYDSFTVAAGAGVQLDAPIRLKKVYFHLQSGLTPGYYVEVIARDPATNATDAYAYVISAIDGHILFRNTLMAEAGTAYTYRVWGSPGGVPQDSPAGNGAIPKVAPVNDGYQAPLIAQADVTLANYPFSRNDPWLPAGAVETVGNNVDAYADIAAPDGYASPAAPATPPTGDFRAQSTGVNAFQHTYDFATPYHHSARQAAITQLFFNVNFMHDWFYDAGFDEAAGNAQQDNYGRGGLGGDRLNAEAQDYSGRNNANMLTPADGGQPRMQMYLFDGLMASPFFKVISPAAAEGRRAAGTATFGPQTFDVTQPVVLPAPLSACSALTNAAAVAGKIVLVDREPTSGVDSCSIVTKMTNIAAAGAAGVVLVNLSGWPDTVIYLSDSIPGFSVPVLTIPFNGALSIKSQLSAGNAVAGQMVRDTVRDRDGTIDNQIVAHEWGHYLSNRLIGNASGLANNQGRGMGEGWSDFLTLLLVVREEDAAVSSNATWNGIYPIGTYALSGGPDGGTNSGYYFGVRRVPYSTDFSKNAFTFKHIQSGVPLPTTAPLKTNGGSNAEVHNTGEVWATMLWECYAALLRDTQGPAPRLTFAEAQTRMKEYLVASLKLTPVNPTFIEARDALLAAAAAGDMADYVAFFGAFARRGAGTRAVAPDRYSFVNSPVVESFLSGGDAAVIASSLNDIGGSCDNDGSLDRGESGQLSITLKNTGTVALNGITGTVSALTAGVTLPSGGAVTFPDLDPLEMASVIVPVAMGAGVTGIQTVQFSLQYAHASMEVSPQTAPIVLRGNMDTLTAATATDNVDAPATPWTLTHGTEAAVAPWARKVTGPQSVWHADDATRLSDERLESPALTISPGGALKIEFDHSYAFDGGYDGGVVELSRNGGAWVDIGGSAYTGSISSGGDNPLGGRRAFTYTSSPVHTTLVPTVAAGDVVRFRFRVGTDNLIGAAGWDIDNITFTGILETPFDEVVGDSGCIKATTTRIATSRNPANAGTSVTLTGTAVSVGNPSGTMTFFDGVSSLGTVAMTGRVGTLTTSSLTVGSHPLTARYDGSASYTQSTSAPLNQLIDNCTGAPVITFLSASREIPAGNPTPLTASASGGASILYEWFEGVAPNTTTPAGTGPTVNVAPFITTTYWVRATNGCASADSASIEVRVIPPSKLYTMTPCRMLDTRYDSSGALAGSATRTVTPFYTNACPIPSSARALAVNVTVVAPAGNGYLTFYPSAVPRPGTTTTSFRTGRTRANNGILSLSNSSFAGSFNVYNGASLPVHFIIDVFGYFQ